MTPAILLSLKTRMDSSRMLTVHCSSNLRGECLPRGGCLPGGGLPKGRCTPSPPPVDRILDTCLWNITFLQLRLRTVTMESLQNMLQPPFWSDSIVSNESSIAGVIAALTLTLDANGTLAFPFCCVRVYLHIYTKRLRLSLHRGTLISFAAWV